MERKMYESPALQVEEFAVNREFAAQCGTQEVSRITTWPTDVTMNCFIEGEEICFSDLAHSVNPSTGEHQACQHVTCVSSDCTGGYGLFGYWGGNAAAGCPAGNYIAWQGAPTGSTIPSSTVQGALADCIRTLSGGAYADGQGWHAAHIDNNTAITEVIYGWSNNRG